MRSGGQVLAAPTATKRLAVVCRRGISSARRSGMNCLGFIRIRPGDQVVLSRPHPCGSVEWRITRTGADIGLECVRCGRRVMLERDVFEHRCRDVRPAAAETPQEDA